MKQVDIKDDFMALMENNGPELNPSGDFIAGAGSVLIGAGVGIAGLASSNNQIAVAGLVTATIFSLFPVTIGLIKCRINDRRIIARVKLEDAFGELSMVGVNVRNGIRPVDYTTVYNVKKINNTGFVDLRKDAIETKVIHFIDSSEQLKILKQVRIDLGKEVFDSYLLDADEQNTVMNKLALEDINRSIAKKKRKYDEKRR